MQDIKETLLNLLDLTTPTPTLALAKKAGFATTKEINPALYSLLAQKQVKKISDDNSANPRWIKLAFLDENKSCGVSKEQILAITSSQQPLSPTTIQQSFAPKPTKKEVNSHLYSLQREGFIVKTCNPDGTSPLWSTM